MNFLYPQFLWALSLLSIPIIIHLFHFRRFKTIFFSNIKFIQSLKNEKQTKTKIKHILILICRLLAITFLVFAFAQPYFKNNIQTLGSGKKSISIYIDNSPSMENTGKSNTLFEQARNTAIDIVHNFQVNDEFQLLTNDLSPKEEKYYNQERAISILEEMQLNSRSVQLETITDKIEATSDNIGSHIVYLISDFQKSTSNLAKINFDSSSNYYLVQEEALSINNIYIDSVWFASPILSLNHQASLQVRIINSSDEKMDQNTLRLNLNGKEIVTNCSLPAQSSDVFSIEFKLYQAGWNTGTLSIDDYPLTFDDTYFISFFIKSQSNILLVSNNENPVMNSVFKTDPFFKTENISSSNYSHENSSNKDLIILNELADIPDELRADLTDYLINGGNVFIIPSSNKLFNTEEYKQLFNDLLISPFEKIVANKQKIDKIDYSHDFLKNVFEGIEKNIDLPLVQKYYSRSKDRYYAEKNLLTLKNGDPFLTLSQVGNGSVFVLSSPTHPEWSNFYNQWLFLPIIYSSALYQNASNTISYQIGKDRSFTIPDSKMDMKSIKFRRGNKDFIPSYKLINGRLYFYLTDEFSSTGFYTLLADDTTSNNSAKVAINTNRIESVTKVYSQDELSEFAKDNRIEYVNTSVEKISSRIAEINNQKVFWKILILLTLFFLLCEILIIRLFR